MSLNFLLTDLSINLKKSPEDIESGSPFLGTKVDMPEPAKAVPLPEKVRHSASAAPAAPWNSQRVRTAVIPAPQPLPCSGHQSCSRRVNRKTRERADSFPVRLPSYTAETKSVCPHPSAAATPARGRFPRSCRNTLQHGSPRQSFQDASSLSHP